MLSLSLPHRQLGDIALRQGTRNSTMCAMFSLHLYPKVLLSASRRSATSEGTLLHRGLDYFVWSLTPCLGKLVSIFVFLHEAQPAAGLQTAFQQQPQPSSSFSFPRSIFQSQEFAGVNEKNENCRLNQQFPISKSGQKGQPRQAGRNWPKIRKLAN